jgi:hypothetical protein
MIDALHNIVTYIGITKEACYESLYGKAFYSPKKKKVKTIFDKEHWILCPKAMQFDEKRQGFRHVEFIVYSEEEMLSYLINGHGF